jgi:peptidoglycan hydrolase CwlO-like protein
VSLKVHIHVHWSEAPAVLRRLDEIQMALEGLVARGYEMAQELDRLEAQVKANTDLETSAVTLIHGLADQIAALKTDPARLQKLSDDLKAKADALAKAITEGTAAGGGPAPAP